MALTLATWDKVVRRKPAKSTEFKALDLAVRDYVLSPAAQQLVQLKNRWVQWNAKLARERKTFRSSDRYQPGCALDDIDALFVQLPAGNYETVIDGVNERRTATQILGLGVDPGTGEITMSGHINWDQPPFVRIGNVFASLTILGDSSWEYLPLRFLTHNFKVLSGRHGNVINPITSDGHLLPSQEAPLVPRATPLIGRNVADPAFDRVIRDRINRDRRRGAFYVDVVDVRMEEDFRTGRGLKNQIGMHLKTNHCVVLGWCYGLYTFVATKRATDAAEHDVSAEGNLLHARWHELMAMPVADVVSRWWSWVPR